MDNLLEDFMKASFHSFFSLEDDVMQFRKFQSNQTKGSHYSKYLPIFPANKSNPIIINH